MAKKPQTNDAKDAAIRKLKTLLEDSTSRFGATNNTYQQILNFFQDQNTLFMPARPLIGQMIFFKYTPIGTEYIRDKYYDIFPLVIVTEVRKNGFEGINLHYLQTDMRETLLNALLAELPTVRGRPKYRNRLGISYNLIAPLSTTKFFRPCYKRYLWSQMDRKPVVIPFDLWNTMINSNTFKFKNERPHRVFIESRQKAISPVTRANQNRKVGR